MERIDIASEPDDGEVLEEIDGTILGKKETRYLQWHRRSCTAVLMCAEARCPAGVAGRCGTTEIMVNGYQHIFVNGTAESRDTAKLYLRGKAGGCDSADCRPVQPR